MPDVAALRKQIVGGDRPPGSGGVKFAVRHRFVLPPSADGIHDAPSRFDFIAADKQSGIASHGFEQQPLVSLRRVSAELAVIAERHADGSHTRADAGDFLAEDGARGAAAGIVSVGIVWGLLWEKAADGEPVAAGDLSADVNVELFSRGGGDVA